MRDCIYVGLMVGMFVFFIYSFVMEVKSTTELEKLKNDRNGWMALSLLCATDFIFKLFI